MTPAQVEYMFAVLADSFHLPPAEAGRLDDYQILRILGHPRDDHGIPIPPPGDGPPESEEDACRQTWLERGWPRTEIERRLAEMARGRKG